MFNRFQEAPEVARCSYCDEPIVRDENESQTFKAIVDEPNGPKARENVHCCQIGRKRHALYFAHKIVGAAYDSGDWGRYNSDAEDAIAELCEAFGYTYGVAANA